jgi:uncharacterized protein with PIN domain
MADEPEAESLEQRVEKLERMLGVTSVYCLAMLTIGLDKGHITREAIQAWMDQQHASQAEISRLIKALDAEWARWKTRGHPEGG